MSDDGLTVGGSYRPESVSNERYGMLWRNGAVTILEDVPGGGDPRAGLNGLSADGTVAVGYGHALFEGGMSGETGYQTAVYWKDGGAPTVLESARVQDNNCVIGDSEARAIADTVIVGWASNCANGEQSYENQLAIWGGQSLMITDATPFGNRIRGGMSVALDPLRVVLTTSGGATAWMWVDSEFKRLEAPGQRPRPYDMTSDGRFVVGASDGGTTWFRLEVDAGAQVLDTLTIDIAAELGATNGSATAISEDGEIIVGNVRGAGSYAAIWSEQAGLRDLNDIVSELCIDTDGWALSFVGDVSADGTVMVGSAFKDGVSQGYRLELPRALLGKRSSLRQAGGGQNACAILVVNDEGDEADADPTDAFCDVDPATEGDQCTLRAAIETVNNDPGTKQIEFTVNFVFLEEPLPAALETIWIDGTTASFDSVHIYNPLTASDEWDGLVFEGAGSRLTGVALTGFRDGLVLRAPSAVVENNYFSRNRRHGVFVDAAANRAVIGGLSRSQGNRISLNEGTGVPVLSAEEVRIENNRIEDNRGVGLYISSAERASIMENDILRNRHHGILLEESSGASIGEESRGNVITDNLSAGVAVLGDNALDNQIVANSIYRNQGIAIDLGDDGVTANDLGTLARSTMDSDTGPNDLVNFPVGVTAADSAGQLVVSGFVDVPE
ncbi:MAG: DUF1565 domain-containing protein, partial [Rhodothermales bacterium]|nr:DUF1565 domain-containing protein [Rhodothermales bacterium]